MSAPRPFPIPVVVSTRGCRRNTGEFETTIERDLLYAMSCEDWQGRMLLSNIVRRFLAIRLIRMPDVPLLELHNVCVQRGDRLALDHLRLSIERGEHVAILGPNGSGKSTLIKTITRECYPLLTPGSSFRILGSDSWNIFELRSHIGVVSNDLMATCTRDITGRELVLSGFFGSIGIWPNHHVTSEMEEKASEAMTSLDAGHLADRWLDELSSGEARRLLIARALIHKPSTLLLDEPTTSLDLAALHEVRDHLRQLARSGIGLLLVTHHLDDIIPEIERVVLLQKGKVHRDGPREEVLRPEPISELFGVDVGVYERNGFYHAW
jgi:iron complex transport system ATP-binding protein